MIHTVKILKLNYTAAFPVYLTIILTVLSFGSLAQVRDAAPTSELKRLSVEDLMNIEVTSVSKRPEKLTEAASAIQVITQENIRSSGVKTLPEALRLASNLQVAQVNSSQWAISARGFNNVLANKLLVLIDGRTVYTPLYAGVFWDVQNLILEDVDRIEVISGPGGTLWGANAVNGVINVITKSARDTKGIFAEAAYGSVLPGLASLRYGGKLANKLSYRVYATEFKMGSTILTNGSDAKDLWRMGQAGFRLDWDSLKNSRLTIQSTVIGGKPNPDGGNTPVETKGDNIRVRWNHKASEISDFQLQAYYDHTLRDFGNGFSEDLKTYDIDWQNRHQFGERHELTYGLDLRLMDHNVTNLPLFAFRPGSKMLYLYSAYLQDEILLIKERLRLTIGSKIEHNSYTNFEYQPNARLAWAPATRQTVWASVSRAVRTPSRIDRDFYLNLNPSIPIFIGGNFKSEELLAYELGWRLQPQQKVSISLSSFFNVYDNIRSAEPGPPPLAPFPITIANGVKGKTYGMELSVTNQLTGWWNLRGGYTFLKKDLSVKPGSKDSNGGTAESDDPENQLLIQSAMNLPGHLEFGTVLRYIDRLPKPQVPDYVGLDMRIGWKINKSVELNVVGQNLTDNRHPEFIPSSPSKREIERSVYGKIICRF